MAAAKKKKKRRKDMSALALLIGRLERRCQDVIAERNHYRRLIEKEEERISEIDDVETHIRFLRQEVGGCYDRVAALEKTLGVQPPLLLIGEAIDPEGRKES